jgi:hypothetical protein
LPPTFSAIDATDALPSVLAFFFKTSALAFVSLIANTFGRVVAQNTGAVLVIVAITLPASHGRDAWNPPSRAENAVQSLSSVESSSAATRGATSLPVAVAAARNAFASSSLTIAATSRAVASALYGAEPASATTRLAPNRPSVAAAASAPSRPTMATTDAPLERAAPRHSKLARTALPCSCSTKTTIVVMLRPFERRAL